MLAMSQKVLDHPKESPTDAFKTSSKKLIQKTAESTSCLIDNEIAYKITKYYKKHFQQNNSEAFTNENNKEIPKERYISSEERHKIIDNIRSFIIV